MKAADDWRIKDWLEAGANLVIILAGIAGAIWFVGDTRAAAIETNRQTLLGGWTNEGDILSLETKFINLALQDYDGDVIGTLTGPGFDETLDVQAEIGWFSSELTITQLRGRAVVPVATVQVEITGNDNRLSWQATSDQLPEHLPSTTTLWPSP